MIFVFNSLQLIDRNLLFVYTTRKWIKGFEAFLSHMLLLRNKTAYILTSCMYQPIHSFTQYSDWRQLQSLLQNDSST